MEEELKQKTRELQDRVEENEELKQKIRELQDRIRELENNN